VVSFQAEKTPVRSDFAKVFGNKIKSTPIKAEYPYSRGEISRYDISLIEANGENHYDMPCSIVAELKLGSKATDRCSTFKDDLKILIMFRRASKLDNSLGIALFLYQSSLENIEIEIELQDRD